MNLLILKTVNALVFFGLIVYFGRKPFQQFFLNRSRALRDEIVSVSRQKELADLNVREFKNKLNQVDGEIAELILEFKKDGEAEKKSLIEKAEKYATRLREDSRRIGVQELGRAKILLKERTFLLALSMAERVIQENIRLEDQNRLVLWGLEKLTGTPHEA